IAVTDDGTSWRIAPRVPEFNANPQFGFSYVNGIACAAGRVTAAGVWSSATSTDNGVTRTPSTMPNQGYPAFATTVKRSASGTWLAVGYWNYVGRSTDGVAFAEVAAPSQVQWYNDVAAADAGRFWIVGEKGTLYASTDDGRTFVTQTVPRK